MDVDGNKIYKAGGVYLGDDLSSTSVSIRYFDITKFLSKDVYDEKVIKLVCNIVLFN